MKVITLQELAQTAAPSLDRPAPLVALVGQPNVGKSTVFNALTGGSQYVSNWPGKTSEHKLGMSQHGETALAVVDLPGVYSLTDNSTEERQVRDCLLFDRPDVAVVIAHAFTLERDLYLLAEVLALPVRVVLAINMVDMAARQGVEVEPHVLEAALGLPVVPMVASRGQGMDELRQAATRMAQADAVFHPNLPEVRADHQAVLAQVAQQVENCLPAPYPPQWVALKLLEGDEQITQMVEQRLGECWQGVHALLLQHDDAALAVASGRYEWIGRMMRAAVVRPKAGQIILTDRIDRFATHPLWGVLLLGGIMGILFWLTYAVGTPLQNWLDQMLVQGGGRWAGALLIDAPGWVSGMVVHGIISGVGTVLTLLPILLIFFLSMGVLEEVGYMARAAYVMDRFMHLMGLHGKSFLPLFLGFGCNVPAVMGARIIESPKARLVTILVAPLVPCTARMAVVTMLAPIFFGAQAVFVSWGLVALSMLALTGVGVLLHEGFLGGEHKAFIMELPLYHWPNPRTLGAAVWGRMLDFLKTAGGIILVVSVILWLLSTYPGGTMETSVLGYVGRFLAPLGRWMGLDWQMMVALLTSFVRKENTIPTLAVLYGVGENGVSLASALGSSLTPAAALAFLAAQVLFIPCLATLATIRQETGSWRWTGISAGLLLVLSLGVGVIIYQGARLLGWGV